MKIILISLLLTAIVIVNSSAQKIPLVDDVENKGAGFATAVLPALSGLPTNWIFYIKNVYNFL